MKVRREFTVVREKLPRGYAAIVRNADESILIDSRLRGVMAREALEEAKAHLVAPVVLTTNKQVRERIVLKRRIAAIRD